MKFRNGLAGILALLLGATSVNCTKTETEYVTINQQQTPIAALKAV